MQEASIIERTKAKQDEKKKVGFLTAINNSSNTQMYGSDFSVDVVNALVFGHQSFAESMETKRMLNVFIYFLLPFLFIRRYE